MTTRSSRDSGPRTRFGFLLLALLHLFVAAAAPAADARLEAEQARHGVHLEGDETSCGLHHDHLFCQLCRTITMDARTELALRSPARGDLVGSVPASDATGVTPAAPAASGPLGPRAPPRA